MFSVWCAQASAYGKDFVFLSTLTYQLPSLFENKCNQQPHIWREILFHQRSIDRGDAKLTCDKLSIALKKHELNYPLANIAVIANQLARCTTAQPDAMSCVTAATGANAFVQPRPDASGYVVHDVLLGELKGYLLHNHCSGRKLWKVLSLVNLFWWHIHTEALALCVNVPCLPTAYPIHCPSQSVKCGATKSRLFPTATTIALRSHASNTTRIFKK